jgi:radial spoke head protein 9
MDIKNFGTEHKQFSSVGITLNLDERVNLELALHKLREQEQFDEVKFWGKVSGVAKDYYLAVVVNYEGHQGFPHKRMFWCNEQTWLFAELPPM